MKEVLRTAGHNVTTRNSSLCKIVTSMSMSEISRMNNLANLFASASILFNDLLEEYAVLYQSLFGVDEQK